MNLLASAPTWLIVLLFFFPLLLAAVEDGWRLEISNSTSIAIAIGAVVAVAIAGPAFGLWQNLLLCIAVLAIGTFMFGRGWMGGGDIKLLAASALWFNLSSGWKLLVAIALAGGVETLLIILLRRLPWPDRLGGRVLLLRRREGIPYGIAIALGVASMAFWFRS